VRGGGGKGGVVVRVFGPGVVPDLGRCSVASEVRCPAPRAVNIGLGEGGTTGELGGWSGGEKVREVEEEGGSPEGK